MDKLTGERFIGDPLINGRQAFNIEVDDFQI